LGLVGSDPRIESLWSGGGQIGGSVSGGGGIGRGIGGVAAAAIAGSAVSILDKPQQCENDKPDCHKATSWELKDAGIYDEHAFKKEHGAIPLSRFDICKCKDGSIRIAQVGQCGKTRDFW
jgi:hypothetical protein